MYTRKIEQDVVRIIFSLHLDSEISRSVELEARSLLQLFVIENTVLGSVFITILWYVILLLTQHSTSFPSQYVFKQSLDTVIENFFVGSQFLPFLQTLEDMACPSKRRPPADRECQDHGCWQCQPLCPGYSHHPRPPSHGCCTRPRASHLSPASDETTMFCNILSACLKVYLARVPLSLCWVRLYWLCFHCHCSDSSDTQGLHSSSSWSSLMLWTGIIISSLPAKFDISFIITKTRVWQQILKIEIHTQFFLQQQHTYYKYSY